MFGVARTLRGTASASRPKRHEATSSAFDKLREGVASLLKKQAQADNPSSASKP